MVERLVWQDECYFTLQVRKNRQNDVVYHQGLKSQVNPKRLSRENNSFSKKLMVSAAITWSGATKPFFIDEDGLKVNGALYQRHLEEELLPAIHDVQPKNDNIFIQDSAPSHRHHAVQSFLKEKFKSRFLPSDAWPPGSPDCNPLDFFFWDSVKCKVYEGRHNNPFANYTELKERIEEVWQECATDLTPIRKAIKQFVPRLQAVADKDGGTIKMLFG
jgi:hypothetical protein